MLTASVSAPNPPQTEVEEGLSRMAPKAPPAPDGWRGVSEGLGSAMHMLQMRMYAPAEDILLQLLEFAPMEGKAWHLLGRCHQAQQRHAKALECFERASRCYRNQNGDDTPPASERLARLLWAQGEIDAARAMLSLLLVHRPEDPALLDLQQAWGQTGTDEVMA